MAVGMRMHDKINEHIQKEFHSGYYYLAMEAYFASVQLDGFANFFSVQALEEREHAIKFFNYVNTTGGRVKLLPIAEPKSDFKSPLEVFQLALEHERYVTKCLHDLVDVAHEERDHTTLAFLQWFITEQIQEEASMDKMVGKLKFVENDGRGLLLLDNELAQRVYVPTNTKISMA